MRIHSLGSPCFLQIPKGANAGPQQLGSDSDTALCLSTSCQPLKLSTYMNLNMMSQSKCNN